MRNKDRLDSSASINADNLAASAKAAGKKGPPPVHLWNPPFCGDLDMRIARDGLWYYLGTPIGRKNLVKLFASIIRKDGDDYFLVTPVEKVGIKVDDAPFVAVDFTIFGAGQNQSVSFRTNMDEEVIASSSKPLRVEIAPDTGEVSPYVLVRSNLEALIDRKSFYRLFEICCKENYEGQEWVGLWSEGTFFPFILASELE